ncbi:hypothetical protein Tco_1034799 [Tanacetum coccineum]
MWMVQTMPQLRNPWRNGYRANKFQRSTTQIPHPVIPISIPKPDVQKTLPKTTPIPESDILKSLPKPNIPYPSRRDDQKSVTQASIKLEKDLPNLSRFAHRY